MFCVFKSCVCTCSLPDCLSTLLISPFIIYSHSLPVSTLPLSIYSQPPTTQYILPALSVSTPSPPLLSCQIVSALAFQSSVLCLVDLILTVFFEPCMYFGSCLSLLPVRCLPAWFCCLEPAFCKRFCLCHALGLPYLNSDT